MCRLWVAIMTSQCALSTTSVCCMYHIPFSPSLSHHHPSLTITIPSSPSPSLPLPHHPSHHPFLTISLSLMVVACTHTHWASPPSGGVANADMLDCHTPSKICISINSHFDNAQRSLLLWIHVFHLVNEAKLRE